MESPPPEGPDTAAARRKRIRPASAIAATTVTLVVAATGASIAIADHGGPEVLGGAAATYVPADGHVDWILDQDGVLRMSESARSIGYEHLLLLPFTAGVAVVNDLSDPEAHTAQLWRETSLTLSGDDPAPSENPELPDVPAQTSDLYRLATDGLSLLASSGGGLGFVYSPALLQLPADVAPGSRWSGAGEALPNGLMTYTARFTASVPENDDLIAASRLDATELSECIQTDGSSVYRDGTGATLLDISEADLWCEGRGRIAIVATVNGTAVVQGPPEAPPGGSASSATPVPVRWAIPGDWKVGEAEAGYHDTFFGDQKLNVALSNAPLRTASGLVIAANQNGDDLTALRPEKGALTRDWIAHPGGEIIGLAAVGTVTIVTTSDRQVVAYAGSGQRLWTLDTSELVLARPVDAGDGMTVVVGLDGTVLSIDAQSGEVAWSHNLDADVSVPATVAGSAVVLVDRAGHITALERTTGEPAWSEYGSPVATTVAVGDTVILVGEDGFARAFDAATGDTLWEARYNGVLRAAVALGDRAVLVTNEQAFALDARTGAVAWKRAGAEEAITDGRMLILLDEETASLIDATGAVEATWDIPSLSTAVYRYSVAGEDGFWVFRSNHPVTTIGAL